MIEEGNGLNQKLVANDEEKKKLEGTIEQVAICVIFERYVLILKVSFKNISSSFFLYCGVC